MKRTITLALFVSLIAVLFVATSYAQDYGRQHPDTTGTMGTTPQTGTMGRPGQTGQYGQQYGQTGQYSNQYLILVATPKKPSKDQIDREWSARGTTEAQKQAWGYENKTVYLIVNANSESDALTFVPADQRSKAKVITLSNFGQGTMMPEGTPQEERHESPNQERQERRNQ